MRIRKWLALAAACMLLISAAGAEGEIRGYSEETGYVYIAMGEYPQTAAGERLPILWRVLTADGEKAYLLSEYILFARCMHADLVEYREVLKGDFLQTDLCIYLNTVFAEDAFTEAERQMMAPFAGDTYIFLPSKEDLQNREIGLGETPGNTVSKILENPGLRAWGTEWAIQNNGYDPAEYTNPKTRYEGSSRKPMPLAELRLFVYNPNSRGGHSPYWTRNQSSSDARHAQCVKASGKVGHLEVGRDNMGVRPGIYLDLEKVEIDGGSGTMEDPYTLVLK